MPTSIYYHFQQQFNVSAGKAFKWCTTYTPGDHALMGQKDARREIENITDQTILLTDTFNIGAENQTEKKKLVQIYPDYLFWTSTHLNGPAKHSQFIYKITAGTLDNSHLDFTGLLLDHGDKKIGNDEAAQLAEEARQEDAGTWTLLAKAMEDDLRH